MWPEGHTLQAGKYKIKRQIGKGGFGLTYLAEDTFLKRQVVIKTPNQQFRADRDYEKFVRRFKREGQALSKITHPNVVQVHNYFQEEGGMPCLAMAHVKGEALDKLIRNKGRLSQDVAVKCFRKLATALHTLHTNGLIHCDVHPGNIILQPDGEPVLIDFGSVKLLQPGTFTVTTTINDVFAPYEQRKKENNPQVTLDIYALAATLYFAVTGQKPQASVDRKLNGDELQPPKQIFGEIEDWLNQSILEGMALEVSDRPPSMQVWMGSLHPPQPSSKSTNGSRFQAVNPRAKTASHSSGQQKKFPWWPLSILSGGYIPTGSILYLISQETSVWAVALAGAIALAGAGVGAWPWVGARTWPWARAWPWAGAGTLAGAWSLALAGTGAVVGAVAVTVTMAWAGAGAGAEARALAGAGALAVVLATLIGESVGYFSALGIWGGMGIGLLSFIQLFLVIAGLESSADTLKKHYQEFKVFVVLEGISILGMIIGWIIGWLFHVSGLQITTWG